MVSVFQHPPVMLFASENFDGVNFECLDLTEKIIKCSLVKPVVWYLLDAPV